MDFSGDHRFWFLMLPAADLEIFHLKKEPLYCVVPETHHLGAEKSIKPNALIEEKLVLKILLLKPSATCLKQINFSLKFRFN